MHKGKFMQIPILPLNKPVVKTLNDQIIALPEFMLRSLSVLDEVPKANVKKVLRPMNSRLYTTSTHGRGTIMEKFVEWYGVHGGVLTMRQLVKDEDFTKIFGEDLKKEYVKKKMMVYIANQKRKSVKKNSEWVVTSHLSI